MSSAMARYPAPAVARTLLLQEHPYVGGTDEPSRARRRLSARVDLASRRGDAEAGEHEDRADEQHDEQVDEPVCQAGETRRTWVHGQ